MYYKINEYSLLFQIDNIGQEVQGTVIHLSHLTKLICYLFVEPHIGQNVGFGRAAPFPVQGLEQQPARPQIVRKLYIHFKLKNRQ